VTKKRMTPTQVATAKALQARAVAHAQAPVIVHVPSSANKQEVTEDDVKVLYRICVHRGVLVQLLKAHTGHNGDAELYEMVMGKLQHTMDQMGLTCV